MSIGLSALVGLLPLSGAWAGYVEQKLTASDGAAYDNFGSGVAIEGNKVLIGARGGEAAYLIDADTGNELQKFTVSGGETYSFGDSVALDGDKALIGAWEDDDDGASSGSAYLFDTTSGNQVQKFTASDGEANDQFGRRSVALSGDTLLMGARRDDDKGSYSGAAYLYTAQTTPPPATVPTPSTLALMLAAGLGLLVSGRRFSDSARGLQA